MLAMARPPEVTEEAFMEYHLYTIPWATTLKHNQQKQVELLSRSGVGLTRKYVVELSPRYAAGPQLENGKLPVIVRL